MAITHTFTQTWTRGTDYLTTNITIASEGEINLDVVVPGSTSNMEVSPVAIDISALKSIHIESDETVTIYTNAASTGAPDHTIVITADTPLQWHTTCGLDSPFADDVSDVTKLYITRGLAGNATVKIRGLQDITP